MPTIETLFGRTILDYPLGGDTNAPDDVIWRLLVDDYDDDIDPVISDFLTNHASPEIDTLVIGNWGYERSPESVISMLVEHKEKLTGLKNLFIGDISYDENEISWIYNGDIGPILANFPQLEYLRIRGGNDLDFSHTEHQNLKHLIIESGGLDAGLLDTVSRMKLPNLLELELWFGDENYGFDGSIDTIKPFIFGHQESPENHTPKANANSNESGYLFPKIKRLGLCNCMFADDVAMLLKEAPILAQLEHLDLSLGVMTDVGLSELIDNPYIRDIESINLNENYISDGDLLDKLRALGPIVSASDQRDETDNLFGSYPDRYDFYVAVGE